jgi:excisionase family DNA binding protein
MSSSHTVETQHTEQTALDRRPGTNHSPAAEKLQFAAGQPRLAFSVSEAAQLLGISEKSVRRLITRRLLRPSRALRHLLIPRKEIERFLDDTTL